MAWFVQAVVRKILVPDFHWDWVVSDLPPLGHMLSMQLAHCQKKIFLFLGVCLFLCLSWRASAVLYRNPSVSLFLVRQACFQTIVILKANLFFCSNSQSSHFSSNKETGLQVWFWPSSGRKTNIAHNLPVIIMLPFLSMLLDYCLTSPLPNLFCLLPECLFWLQTPRRLLLGWGLTWTKRRRWEKVKKKGKTLLFHRTPLLVATFNALCGLEPGYLQDHLSTVVSIHLIRSSRKGTFQVQFVRDSGRTQEESGSFLSWLWHPGTPFSQI